MLNLQQRQSLQQKLSPQQIQYIKLLQLPTLALEQRIKAELEINPLLEEGLDEEEEELEQQSEMDDSQVADSSEQSEQEGETLDGETVEEDEYNWEEFLDSTEDLYGYKAQVDNSEEEEQREIPLPDQVSMAEHLRQQILFLDFNDTDQLIADQIIGSIDEDGYLRRPLESIIDDIVFNYGVMLEESDVEDVLKRVQRLEPVGIAARDLQECLVVQLETMPADLPGRDAAIDRRPTKPSR